MRDKIDWEQRYWKCKKLTKATYNTKCKMGDQVQSRRYCGIRAIYNTICKIGDKIDTECKVGDVPNFRGKVKAIYNTKCKLGGKIDTDCKIEDIANFRLKYRRRLSLSRKYGAN